MEAVKPKVSKKRKTKIKSESTPVSKEVSGTLKVVQRSDEVVCSIETTSKLSENIETVEKPVPTQEILETSTVGQHGDEIVCDAETTTKLIVKSETAEQSECFSSQDEKNSSEASLTLASALQDSVSVNVSEDLKELNSVAVPEQNEKCNPLEQNYVRVEPENEIVSCQKLVCDNVQEELVSSTQHTENSESVENTVCSENVIQASCPEITEMPQVDAYIQPLYPVEELAQALEKKDQEEQQLLCLKTKSETKIIHKENLELMKPFTEEQLLALYRNEELETNDAFIDYFILHEKDPQNSEFYELLEGYLRSRQKLVMIRKERDETINDYVKFASNVWTMQAQTVTGMSPCADGVNITKSHVYQQAVMNQGTLTSVNQLLQQLREQVHETLALHAYGAEVAKLQIEAYIYALLAESTLVQVPCNAPVTVILPHELTRQQADENQQLRECIGDLFSFQRRPISDKTFIDETRKWLTHLVALLLRRSTIGDHLFILNHVLRCPAGINNWATCFVQPLPPIPWSADPYQKHYLSSSLLDHSLTVLATLLLPVRARDIFLQSFAAALRSANPGSYTKKGEDTLWVLVDSEGEEDEDLGTMWLQWQELDVISLINQVPLADLFRHALFIHSMEDADDYDVKRTEEHGMLRLLALGSRLLQLLGQGFQTYNSLRFKQLTKRISRLIRHTVQYMSDHWEAFCLSSTSDPALLKRMQVEFDNFFLRAINCIFSSQRMGAWQFMAVLPYKNVSLPMMWCVLWTLHHINHIDESQKLYNDINYQEKLKDPMVRILFEEKLSQLPESEAFYLLTAFANMAKARGPTDKSFISAVCLEVMEIAFLNVRLRESLSKEGRDLLSAIATKHHFVMSLLLGNVVENIEKLGMMSLYLFRSLPLSLWLPEKADLDIVCTLLLDNPLPSAANQLAKLIITSMNWEDNPQKDKLFLSPDTHYKIAMLVVQACERHARQDSDSGIIMWSLQQALLVTQSLRQSATQATTPQGFLTWAWDTLLSLRLHVLDRPCVPWTSVLAGDVCGHDPNIPHLEGDPRLHYLQMGLKTGQPAALYVALLMTTTGHSLQSLNERGLSLWSTLVAKEMYPAATHILSFVLPFFYPTPSLLLNNQRFLNDLLYIVLADLTYKSVAKSLIYTVFPGKALQHFAAMLKFQINQGRSYTAEIGGQSVRFWCQVLFHLLSSSHQKSLLSKWKGTDHVHYLLDQLFKIALHDAYLLDTLMETMAHMVKDQAPIAGGGGVAASIFSFVSWSTGSGTAWPSLLSFATLPNFPCLFWGVLAAETNHPQMTNLWESLFLELASNSQISPEVALKNVCVSLHLPVPMLTSLPIYRLAQQVLEMDIQHPSLPLHWQNFFVLYLFRTRSDKRSLGFRLFADNPHLSLLKKMKRRLGETSEHYKKTAAECSKEIENLRKKIDDDDHADENQLLTKIQASEAFQSRQLSLMRFYRSLALWIEEPRLHDSSLNLQNLPQQYDAERLQSVIDNIQKPWLDLVDMTTLQNELEVLDSIWLQQRKALPALPPLFDLKEELSASDRILKRLKAYEDPLPAPRIPRLQSFVTQVTPELVNNDQLLQESVKQSTVRLIAKASTFQTNISKHLALDSEYVELLPSLYRNVDAQTLVRELCKPSSGDVCAGPATFYLKYKEARMMTGVHADLQNNRSSYEELLEQFNNPPDLETCAAAVFVKNCVIALVKQNCNKSLGESRLKRTKETGVSLFYHLLSFVDNTTNHYPPTRQFISSCLDVLGQDFIHGHEDQCLSLIQQVLSRPSLAGLVAPLFSPAQVSCASFLQLYDVLTSKLCPALSSALFVLLTKFDIGSWLRNAKPGIPDREKLLQSMFSALRTIGREPSDDMLVVLDVFRNHLQQLYLYEYPELFGQMLQSLLNGSSEGWVNVCVWEDFICSLAGNCHRPQTKSKELVGQWLITFASTQPHLHPLQTRESLDFVNKFLLQLIQSSKQTKKGIYQSLSSYFDPIVHLIAMLAHAYISLAHSKGPLFLWEAVREVFGPWLEPLSGETSRLPFALEEADSAKWVLDLFVLTIMHLHNTCSRGSQSDKRSVLNYVWQWYAKLFAKSSTVKHIRSTTQGALQFLPWAEFVPLFDDFNSMKLVLECGLTDCQDFLGYIFLNVPWMVVSENIEKYNKEVTAPAVNILASLFVQLSWNPFVMQSGQLSTVVSSLEAITLWPLLSAAEVQQLVQSACCLSEPNKFIQKAFPEVLVFRFLQCVSGFRHPKDFDVEKRRSYIVGAVSLTAKATPLLVQNRKKDFTDTLSTLLDQCLAPTLTNICPTFQEMCLLLSEYVWLLTPQACNAESRELSFAALLTRLQGGGPMVHPLVAVVCRTQLAKPAHLVQITELALEVACNTSLVLDDGYSGWRQLVPLLVIDRTFWEEFFKACLENSAHLSQNAFLLHNLPGCQTTSQELDFLQRAVDWCSNIKASEEAEPKLLLLWDKVLELSLRQLDQGGDTKATERHLQGFCAALQAMGEDKLSAGLLGAVGFGKRSPFSTQFRLMCRSMCAFILCQLPLNGEIRLTPNAPGHVRSVEGSKGKPSQQALQALAKVESARTSKQYSLLVQQADYAWNFILDARYSLRDSRNLIKEFSAMFYSKKAFLKILCMEAQS